MEETNQKKLNRKRIVMYLGFIGSFIAGVLFLFLRCRYGIANIDESYYVSIPYRLFQGDRMMLEEWGITQLSTFLMVPFVSLYLRLFQSTDGIILAARYLYLFLSIITAIVVFVRIKSINLGAAMIGSLCVLMYAPFGIAAASYNSMGIMLLVVMCVCVATEEEFNIFTCCFLGLLLAGAVLCCPYLLLPVSMFFCALIIISFTNKNLLGEINFFQWRVFVGIILGGGTLFVLFCVYAFYGSSVSNIIASIPYILNDGAHKSSFVGKCYEYLYSMVWKYKQCIPLFFLETVIAFYMCSKKNRNKNGVGFIVLQILTVICEILVWKNIHYINFIFIPVNFMALVLCFVFRNEANVRKAFGFIYIPGIIYSICLHFSSNQASYAIASAMAVSLVGSVIIIVQAYREVVKSVSNSQKYITTVALALVFGILIFSEVELRYTNVFWDTDIKTQTVYISEGPEKGIYASERMAATYSKINQNVTMLRQEYDTSKVLFVSESFQTLYYLYDDIGTGAPSSWNIYNQERMDAYYEINPQMRPTVVYCDKNCDLEFLGELLGDYEIAEETNDYVIYTQKENA